MTDNDKLAEVMGWRILKDGKYRSIKGGFIMFVNDWHPDTSIEQAMMLVEKMREKKSYWLTLHQISCKQAPWEAYFTFGGMAVGNRQTEKTQADLPEKAIVEAILKVMEGEGWGK